MRLAGRGRIQGTTPKRRADPQIKRARAQCPRVLVQSFSLGNRYLQRPPGAAVFARVRRFGCQIGCQVWQAPDRGCPVSEFEIRFTPSSLLGDSLRWLLHGEACTKRPLQLKGHLTLMVLHMTLRLGCRYTSYALLQILRDPALHSHEVFPPRPWRRLRLRNCNLGERSAHRTLKARDVATSHHHRRADDHAADECRQSLSHPRTSPHSLTLPS